jgi:hypothetical protein
VLRRPNFSGFLDNAIVVMSDYRVAGASPPLSVASSRWGTLQRKKRFGLGKKTLILC